MGKESEEKEEEKKEEVKEEPVKEKKEEVKEDSVEEEKDDTKDVVNDKSSNVDDTNNQSEKAPKKEEVKEESIEEKKEEDKEPEKDKDYVEEEEPSKEGTSEKTKDVVNDKSNNKVEDTKDKSSNVDNPNNQSGEAPKKEEVKEEPVEEKKEEEKDTKDVVNDKSQSDDESSNVDDTKDKSSETSKKEDKEESVKEKSSKEEVKEPEEDKDEKPSKEENAAHNKTLRNIFLVLGAIAIIAIVGFVTVDSARNFEYRGITGNVVKEGELVFWHTTLPFIYQGEEAEYNFYLRNDPSKLDWIPFDGELLLLKNTVINTTEEFKCDGKGIISIVNLNNLYSFIGSKVIQDPTATCSEDGLFMYINIKPGDETRIEKVGPACYDLYVNNCEILEVTEKFMYETLVKVNEELEKNPNARLRPALYEEVEDVQLGEARDTLDPLIKVTELV